METIREQFVLCSEAVVTDRALRIRGKARHEYPTETTTTMPSLEECLAAREEYQKLRELSRGSATTYAEPHIVREEIHTRTLPLLGWKWSTSNVIEVIPLPIEP